MNLRQALSHAVMELLQPLVRVLLRHGMAYDEFAELARRAYVQVAERDFTLQGRKQTTSRISVITGLNRKEVARLQAISAQGDTAGAELVHTLNRAAKVVAGWRHEHAEAGGTPSALDAERFAALVRKHSGDMPARAVLDELRNDGAVTVAEDGRYQLAPEGYGARSTDAGRIALLGQHAADMLGSIEHNLTHPQEQAYLQRRVFAENVPVEQIESLRARLRDTGLKAIADARTLLIASDAGEKPPPTASRRVTLGVYYYEQPADRPAADPPALEPATPPPAPQGDRS